MDDVQEKLAALFEGMLPPECRNGVLRRIALQQAELAIGVMEAAGYRRMPVEDVANKHGWRLK